MASSVNHQSQLRVPPTPRSASLPTRCVERKLQPGVDQRRGLARSRRADDDVPRQIVQAVSRSLPPLVQRADGLFEAFAKLGRLRRRPILLLAGWREHGADEPVGGASWRAGV